MNGNPVPNCCLIYRDRFVEIHLFGPAALAELCAGVSDFSQGICPQLDVGIPRPGGRSEVLPVQCLGGPFDGNEVCAPQVLVGSLGIRPALSITTTAAPHRPSVYRWDDHSFRYDRAATSALRGSL